MRMSVIDFKVIADAIPPRRRVPTRHELLHHACTHQLVYYDLHGHTRQNSFKAIFQKIQLMLNRRVLLYFPRILLLIRSFGSGHFIFDVPKSLGLGVLYWVFESKIE